jgi:hypothetical protein
LIDTVSRHETKLAERFSLGSRGGITPTVVTADWVMFLLESSNGDPVRSTRAVVQARFSRIRGRLPCGEDGDTETKTEEEVVHSSRSSSKSYLCTEAGQP